MVAYEELHNRVSSHRNHLVQSFEGVGGLFADLLWCRIFLSHCLLSWVLAFICWKREERSDK